MKMSAFFVFVMLIALLLAGCQLSHKGTENEALTHLRDMGLRAKEIKDPVFVSGTEGFEGPPPETEEDVLARINSGILVQGTITKLEAVRIPAGGEVWYVVAATVRADEVLYGSAPDEIRISAAVAFDRKEETKGVAPIPSLSGCCEGASGLFLITRKTDTACWWIINEIAVDAERIGEYSLMDRFDRKKNSIVTLDGSISIPFDALGVETPAAQTDTADEEAESLWYDSIPALEDAVRAERNASQKNQTGMDNRLEDLSVLYAPAAPYEGFALYQVEVNPYFVFYYYLPEDDQLGQIDSKKDIIVTVHRSDEFTMESLCKQQGITPDADGFAYVPEKGDIFFQLDDTVIMVHAPEHMNDYNTLRSLCEMKRIEINKIGQQYSAAL